MTISTRDFSFPSGMPGIIFVSFERHALDITATSSREINSAYLPIIFFTFHAQRDTSVPPTLRLCNLCNYYSFKFKRVLQYFATLCLTILSRFYDFRLFSMQVTILQMFLLKFPKWPLWRPYSINCYPWKKCKKFVNTKYNSYSPNNAKHFQNRNNIFWDINFWNCRDTRSLWAWRG